MTTPADSADLICSIDVSAGTGVSTGHPGFSSGAENLIVHQLRELTAACRELVGLAREQLEMTRRAEERFQRQHVAQREEFERWVGEHAQLAGRCKNAEEVIRTVLGTALSELVEYVEDNQENLLDSDFVRGEMVDRYGALLNHVSAMYAVLKRLAAVDQPGAGASNAF